MGVAELGAWDQKPAWVTSALRGLTGPGASDHAQLFGTPVRAGGEASAALAQNAAAGAALAKIIATGSGLAPQPDAVRPVIDRMAFDEIAATARRLALPVAVHCHGGDVVEWAAEAGVDSIEHGLYLDRGQLEILCQRSIRLTLTPGAYLSARRGEIGPALRALVRDALETGIELGVGTDGGQQTMLGQLAILVELGVPFASAIAICAGTTRGDGGPDGSRPLVLFANDPGRDPAALAEPLAVFDPGDGPGAASEQPEAMSA
jgi:imidazolonepropionase-like amidohydrolase